MKTFVCECGNRLHFENSQCLACGRTLGFLPDARVVSALEPVEDGSWRALANGGQYRQCANYTQYDVCNWMVPVTDNQVLCASCRLNQIIPNLNDSKNLLLWVRIETAKRRLLYTLSGLGLPVVDRISDPQYGLAFKFMEDPQEQDEFSNEITPTQRVITGHRTGIITINIMEAEDSAREQMREKMNERYRTLLGHFRHEIGHYYWGRMISNSDWLNDFRALFGDERTDYTSALKSYYDLGPQVHWEADYVSAYASVHPWEDWAESWAHYLHMVDTLETAADFGFRMSNGMDDDFECLLEDWAQLSVAMNALNRSMGLGDAYPFVLSGKAKQKLRFIHKLIKARGSVVA